MHGGERRRQLSLAAVDHDEVRRRREALVPLLRPFGQPGETARDHLGHGREVIHAGLAPHAELAVVGFPGDAVREDHHRADVLRAHGRRDVEALDPDRQRLQVQGFAELLQRLVPAQALLLRDGRLRLQHVPRVLRGQFLQPALLSALGDPDVDAGAAPLGEELREGRHVAGVSRDDDLRRDRGSAAVVLQRERLEDRPDVLPRDVLEVERVAIDEPAVAKRKDLHHGAIPVHGEADHVDRADGAAIRVLALCQVLHGPQAVPVPRGVLEAFLCSGLAHLPLELPLDRAGLAREELDHLVDDRAVLVLRYVADAGREAAVDVVVETRNPGMPSGLRALAGSVREDAVQDVERLAHLLRVRVRAEVPDAAAVTLAREHDPRVLVLDGDRDVRERLVVAEPDVERRPVPLHEVLLEVERLDLVLRHDHLDVGHALGQLADRGTRVVAGLEVRPDPGPKRLRLPDVEHVALLVSEEIDARLGRERLQLLLDGLRGHAGQSSRVRRDDGSPRKWRAARLERPGRCRDRSCAKEWRASRPSAARACQRNPDVCQRIGCKRGWRSPIRGILAMLTASSNRATLLTAP